MRQLQHGDVTRDGVAGDGGGVPAVRRDVDYLELGRAVDHVVVREDLAGAGDDHSGPRGETVLVTERRVDVDDADVRACLDRRIRRVPGAAGRRGGYGRRQRRQDGEQEASRQPGHESIRAGVDEPHLNEVKAACKPPYERGSTILQQTFNRTGATE